MVLLIGLATSVGFFAFAVLQQDEDYTPMMMVSGIVSMWMLCLLAIAAYFPAPLVRLDVRDGVVTRVGKRIRNAIVWLIVAGLILLCGASIIATVRIVNILV